MKQILSEEFRRMQKLAGIITEEQFDGEYFGLQAAFKASPMSHSYNDVLSIINDYEDEDILEDFMNEFPKDQNINKDKYLEFVMDYMDDMSEMEYLKANWVSLTDPDIFEKAGL